MTARNSAGKNPGAAIGATIIFAALAFWFFTSFSQRILSTRGSVGNLNHLPGLAELATQHPLDAVGMAGCLVLAAAFGIVSARRTPGGAWLPFFASRTGTTLLLLAVALCEVPIYFTPGLLDYGDSLCNTGAMREAAANYREGSWPFYTFHFANGVTLGLQYPQWRTLFGGLLMALSPLGPDADYKLISAGFHLLMLAGFYRFLRAWNFSRLACVLPALALTGCHQMMVYYLSGSFSTQLASGLAPWSFVSLARWFRSRHWRHGAACGYWLGFIVLAHPVTALFTGYFLVLLGGGLFLRAVPAERKRLALQAWAPALCCLLVALSYLVSLTAFRGSNDYRPEKVAAFQDKNLSIAQNFNWIFKYFGHQPAIHPPGEYISLIIFILAAAGLVALLRTRAPARNGRPLFSGYGVACLVFFALGAILFYGRDTAPVMAIPGVKLLKVYNRSFIFFALGLGLLAARPLDDLLRGRRPAWVLALGLLLLAEQAPYWVRPSFFSLPDNLRFRTADFAGDDRKTSCFLAIYPPDGTGCGNREEVFFHRHGFSGFGPVDLEEKTNPGVESQLFHNSLNQIQNEADIPPILERLKWLRVTDVVWRRDARPALDLSRFGRVRLVTNGVDLHLDGPVMERALRTVKLQTVPTDAQPDGTTLLPIGFSPFLHCTLNDQSGAQIPLLNRGGYASISLPLAPGTGLILKAITPWYQSLATWVSLFFIAAMGFYLATAHRRHKSA